jgi:hypothetical protein
MFARHPAAESVVVDFGYDRVPPMAALQAGATPGWRSLYKARVVKSGGARR